MQDGYTVVTIHKEGWRVTQSVHKGVHKGYTRGYTERYIWA